MTSEGPDPFVRIAQTLSLSDALALVFIVGPGDRPVEGFAKVRAALPAESEILWHRLDRDGPAIAPTLDQAKTSCPVVFVHGLERLPEKARKEAEVRLNLLRDAFSYRRAAVLFWVPSEVLDEFLLRCPDLYAWRSLMVVLDRADVPLSEELLARRAFLARERTRLGDWPNDADEPYVIPDDSPATRVAFSEWVSRLQRGILFGPAGSGKTGTLRSFAWRQIDLAQGTGDLSYPVPLLIAGPRLALVLESDGDDHSQLWHLGLLTDARLTISIEHWAGRGEVMLLVDGLDELPPRSRSQMLAWLKCVAQEWPRMQILVSSRPDPSLLDLGWEQATLDRSPSEQRRRVLLWMLWDEEPTRQETLFRAVEGYLFLADPDGLMTDRELLEDLVGTWRKEGRIPWSRTELLARLLGRRVKDEVRRVFRKAPIVQGEQLLYELRECASNSLQTGDDTFSRQALLQPLWLATADLALQVERDQDLRYVLVTRAGLLEDAGPDHYRFSHRLYRDFFAAEALARRAEDEAVSALCPHVGDVAWHDVIAFTTALRQKGPAAAPASLNVSGRRANSPASWTAPRPCRPSEMPVPRRNWMPKPAPAG